MVWYCLDQAEECAAEPPVWDSLNLHFMREEGSYFIVIRRTHSQIFSDSDWASEILPTMFISCKSLLQWNISELITYLQVLPFHSYIPNEFFPMTSSFVSIALSLILSHLLYLSSWLQDIVKCMEVVLFQGCPRTLNSYFIFREMWKRDCS